jgi:hypothetical protein
MAFGVSTRIQVDSCRSDFHQGPATQVGWYTYGVRGFALPYLSRVPSSSSLNRHLLPYLPRRGSRLSN